MAGSASGLFIGQALGAHLVGRRCWRFPHFVAIPCNISIGRCRRRCLPTVVGARLLWLVLSHSVFPSPSCTLHESHVLMTWKARHAWPSSSRWLGPWGAWRPSVLLLISQHLPPVFLRRRRRVLFSSSSCASYFPLRLPGSPAFVVPVSGESPPRFRLSFGGGVGGFGDDFFWWLSAIVKYLVPSRPHQRMFAHLLQRLQWRPF